MGGAAGGPGMGVPPAGYALGPSSSLTRLHHPHPQHGGHPQHPHGGHPGHPYGAPPPMFQTGDVQPPPLTGSSSGHLAQDMEELSLSHRTAGVGACEPSTLPHMQQMFCGQQANAPLLPLLSHGAGGGGGGNDFMAMSSAQHSHQSSMDSGVGPSVAGGHSIPSANQTPEHTKMTCFDPRKSLFGLYRV